MRPRPQNVGLFLAIILLLCQCAPGAVTPAIDIRLRFPDKELQATASSDILQFGTAAVRLAGYSRGNETIAGTVTPSIFTLPHATAWYEALPFADRRAAIASDARKAYGADLSVYDLIIYHFPEIRFGANSGYGTPDGQVWMNGTFDPSLLCHEIGHAFGLYHACWWKSFDCSNPFGAGDWVNRGDKFDVMGAIWGTGLDFNPYSKWLLHWMPVQFIANSGTYRVYRFDSPATINRPLAIAIMRNTGDDSAVFIGLHAKVAVDRAYVVVGWTQNNGGTGLIARNSCANEFLWPVGSTIVDKHFTASIIGYGGSYPEQWIDVKVTLR